MPKLSANLSWLFGERPPLERFAAAAACGFTGVEMLFPYAMPADEVAAELRERALSLALINLPPGDGARGERGFAARPGDEDRFHAALETALAYAAACACPRLHVMSGMRRDDATLAAHEDTLVANLREVAPRCAAAGITLVIEPLNAVDNPGYVLSNTAQALNVLDRVAQPNVALQLDLYHTTLTEGDAAPWVRAARGRIGHVQVAGTPQRNEPDTGTLDYRRLFELLDEDGYDGWIGCEYKPATTTEAGLGWAAPYL